MMRTMFVFAFATAAAAPTAALAQGPTSCRVSLDTAGTMMSREPRPGVSHIFASGGVVFHCLGQQTYVSADSMAFYEDRDRVDMTGHVRFRDSTVTLDADQASYFLRDERLEAYRNVRLENRKSRSRLTGPALTYRRAVRSVRDTAVLFAPERPTVHYRSERDSANAEPYVIVGDRVTLRGNSRAAAAGTVTIDRSDFHANADSTDLDMDAGRGRLVGHAKVAGDSSSYTLTGRSIDFRMTQRKLTWARANGLADATSDEWRLVADTIVFDIANERVQGGVAWGDSLRGQAKSITQTIEADSIVIKSPNQQLSEVRGIGRASAQSRFDTLAVRTDWMMGDTLVATFDSTTASRSALTLLDARMNARVYYHIYGEDPAAEPAIAYVRGAHIMARFGPLGVERVDVVDGEPNGVHLEPLGRRGSQ